MAVLSANNVTFELSVPVAIIGGGACGMVAGLALNDAGIEAIVLERDAVPQGSTALSSGMVPACGTRQQCEHGIEDSVEMMAADIQQKAHGEADPIIVDAVCRNSGPTVDWLRDSHRIDLTLDKRFLYPGHRCFRMHAPPSRMGADLIGALSQASGRAGVDIITNARVIDLFADMEGTVHGLRLQRPDGSTEDIGCEFLILACNGFGGNRDMVQRYIPEMAKASFFGHVGNQGDAIQWGQKLEAATRHLGAYQGHGSVAHPQGILITWALMIEGGIQVNAEGSRFSNEHSGYSEQARRVISQPGGIVWNIYDQRLHELGMTSEDYRQAEKLDAVRFAKTLEDLAAEIGISKNSLSQTFDDIQQFKSKIKIDPFGRDFTTKPVLKSPFYAIKVTGSLFHTQGGLVVDENAQVLRDDGSKLPNLFAGGGATCGISGPSDWGYLSGNGLLTAVVQGRIAGISTAKRLRGSFV